MLFVAHGASDGGYVEEHKWTRPDSLNVWVSGVLTSMIKHLMFDHGLPPPWTTSHTPSHALQALRASFSRQRRKKYGKVLNV